MLRKCEKCGIEFESEGHHNGAWLTLCLECNIDLKKEFLTEELYEVVKC